MVRAMITRRRFPAHGRGVDPGRIRLESIRPRAGPDHRPSFGANRAARRARTCCYSPGRVAPARQARSRLPRRTRGSAASDILTA